MPTASVPPMAEGPQAGPLPALRRALEACERNTASDRQETARLFSARFIREISATLPLEEISVVLRAERVREQGLALARAHKLAEAGPLIAEARALVEAGDLSPQGRAAALTFQTAAESYLNYADGRHEAAIGDLVRSIDLCRVLAEDFGQEMEFRKIHLGRNLLRVRAFTAPGADLLAAHVALIAYMEGDAAAWPIAACAGWNTHRPLLRREHVWNLEEVLANIPLVLSRAPGLDTSAFVAALAPLEGRDGLPAAAFHWSHAMHAAARDEPQPLLHHATAFLHAENGALPLARAALVERLAARGWCGLP